MWTRILGPPCDCCALNSQIASYFIRFLDWGCLLVRGRFCVFSHRCFRELSPFALQWHIFCRIRCLDFCFLVAVCICIGESYGLLVGKMFRSLDFVVFVWSFLFVVWFDIRHFDFFGPGLVPLLSSSPSFLSLGLGWSPSSPRPSHALSLSVVGTQSNSWWPIIVAFFALRGQGDCSATHSTQALRNSQCRYRWHLQLLKWEILHFCRSCLLSRSLMCMQVCRI